ncbi:hypothetical protein [Bradyrhizobium sp. CCBAU 11434]|uniref:hypothetical protein n=1 Tax=Bradyrhizobium sp. CCBAU 11434 TaxID=1630885 RepID=UPI0023060885|nr:hypothetical protein [Bradyrhizobium sp. CCBAU 11434]
MSISTNLNEDHDRRGLDRANVAPRRPERDFEAQNIMSTVETSFGALTWFPANHTPNRQSTLP